MYYQFQLIYAKSNYSVINVPSHAELDARSNMRDKNTMVYRQ